MAVALLAAAKSYRDRPRGWVRADLVTTAESPVAGKGLFATSDIPAGTVLGAYPGLPRSEEDMKQKAASAPKVAQYVFSTGGRGHEGVSEFPTHSWVWCSRPLCRI